MMLLQEATPAQIGAFMIAHRIKRPTSQELAGMLDAYEQIGPHAPTRGHGEIGNWELRMEKMLEQPPCCPDP
jgi:anthranilate phosphoribosyltransferase